MKFKDREEVATFLLKRLEKYKGTNPLVLGIPRGAVKMAEIIATGLQGELSVILVHKIPAPYNDEFAIGSIGLSGHVQLMPYVKSMEILESHIKTAAKEQLEVLKARQHKYGLSELNCENRNVIIVDDGIATGATTLSAIHEIRNYKPKKIIIAVGVASEESMQKISTLVDELIVLVEPPDFHAVGQFYSNFSQVSDQEVEEILKANQNKPKIR